MTAHAESASSNALANQLNTTLVTGATGFVGGELIKRLLRSSDRHLVCPVRANSAAAARVRGEERMTELFGQTAHRYRGRVEWLRGDLEERDLGWSERTKRNAVARINEVFHCAASVQFNLPLAEARRINLNGTVHVHDLALAAQATHGNFRRFHHVSTAYVAGTQKGTVDADFLPPDEARRFRNTYERTKAQAERWLRAQATADVPISIHRPSIVGGDTITGETDNWNVVYVPMRFVARGQMPCFTRGGKELVDSVGVDFVVDAMMAFADLDTDPLHSHLLTAGPTAFTVTDLMNRTHDRAAAAGGTPSLVNLLSPNRWRLMVATLGLCSRMPKRFATLRRKGRLGKRGLAKFAMYLPYTKVNTIFDAGEEHAQLGALGIRMPHGLRYLDTIIDYAIATDFGRVPAGQTAPSADASLVGVK